MEKRCLSHSRRPVMNQKHIKYICLATSGDSRDAYTYREPERFVFFQISDPPTDNCAYRLPYSRPSTHHPTVHSIRCTLRSMNEYHGARRDVVDLYAVGETVSLQLREYTKGGRVRNVLPH